MSRQQRYRAQMSVLLRKPSCTEAKLSITTMVVDIEYGSEVWRITRVSSCCCCCFYFKCSGFSRSASKLNQFGQIARRFHGVIVLRSKQNFSHDWQSILSA